MKLLCYATLVFVALQLVILLHAIWKATRRKP